MSAFAGIFHLDGRPAEPSAIESMLLPLARRGPHGSYVWTHDEVGLGHGRLHTTPESLDERQPFTDPSGAWTIVADARLDNRAELLTQLRVPDAFAPDVELILAAYARWGTNCAAHLLGDFSFVIWDRDHRTIFGARDHLGIRPFYYHRQAGRVFAFGSDPAAVLAAPGVPRVINESRIADYLVPALEGSDKTSTFYRDVFRLPPAHTITVSPSGMQLREYWSLAPAYELRLGREEDYVESFRAIFSAAVQSRLRSSGPVAAMLSGGLDSSAVVAFARSKRADAGEAALRTYSCLMRDPAACCETPYVNATVQTGGLDPRFIYDDELDSMGHLVEDHFSDATDLFDFADIPLIAYYQAGHDRIHVMLDGVDGDVVASANAVYLSDYARAGNARAFLAAASGYASYYGLTGGQTARLVWDQGLKPLIKPRVPAGMRAQWENRSGRWWDSKTIPWKDPLLRDSLISREFAERVGLAEKLVTLGGDTRWADRNYRENDAVTLAAPFITAALERYGRSAAQHSIEARHPFFDKRVVEFCLSLPLEIKQSGGWAKLIVRHATAGLLPDQVRWRRPGAVNLNQHFFVTLMGPHLARMADSVRTGLKEISQYVNHATLSSTLAKSAVDIWKPDSLWRIYQSLRLLTWLRRN